MFNHDRSVGIAAVLRESKVQFRAGVGDSSLLRSVQIDSKDYPASYKMSTGDCFHEVKGAGA